MSTLRRLPWERATQLMIAVAIFGIASGSSSIRYVIEHSRGGLRWGALFALCSVAVAWAVAEQPRLRFVPLLAAAAFAGLCLDSIAWSVEPRLTFERTVTLGVLLVAAAAVAHAAGGRSAAVGSALLGVLFGGVAVGVASLATLALTHSNAIQPATLAYGARFQGYSQNPNTLGMLLAPATAIGAWWLVSTRSRGARIAAAVCLLLVFGELVATGSRGSLAGALVALLVLIAFDRRPLRTRALAAAACVIVVAACAVVTTHAATPAKTAAPTPRPPPGRLARDAELKSPLGSELGAPAPGQPVQKRGLFSSSGRFRAWHGAIRQADQRPVAGYGFGTEGDVFADRYYGFDSNLAENSYIGLYLQLGVAGLLLFATFVAVLLLAARPIRGGGDARVAALAVALGCLVIGVGQSFLYSVGATGALPFWVCAFLASVSAPRTA